MSTKLLHKIDWHLAGNRLTISLAGIVRILSSGRMPPEGIDQWCGVVDEDGDWETHGMRKFEVVFRPLLSHVHVALQFFDAYGARGTVGGWPSGDN